MSWICPVCRKPGERTQEHVFAKWLARLFGVLESPVGTFNSRQGRMWGSRGFNIVVDACAACNGGWMSALENEFRAAFSGAILGTPTTFGPAELTTLAHWSSKTAIMLQPHLAGVREASHVPSGHLASLPFATPSGTRVWLGAYAPVTRYVSWQNVPMFPGDQPLGSAVWSGYVMLMTIGHMVVVVLGVDNDRGDDFSVVGLPDGIFRPVWPLPATPVEWPQGFILNDELIASFWPPKPGRLIAVGTGRRT